MSGGRPATFWVDETTNIAYWRDSNGAWHAISAGSSSTHVDLVWSGTAYPARPSTGTCPAGGANYIGPVAQTPPDWVDGDTWDAY